jgi:hypothetical protein
MPLFNTGDTDYVAKLNKHYTNTTITVGSTGSYNLDLSLGYVFTLNFTAGSAAACTLTLNNKPSSGTPFEITIFVKFGTAFAHTITYPTTTYWVGGSAPGLGSSASTTNIIKIRSLDAGTTFYGERVGGAGSYPI